MSEGGAHTRYFVYDSQHRLMVRWDNGVETDFVYVGSKPIARIEGSSTSYIHDNYQHSPLFETDSTGTVTRTPDFWGYGQPVNADGLNHIPGYTGAAIDSEAGLLYLGARYLSAPRFLSPDPAGLDPTSPMGLNRYAYANDNPVRFVDPEGMEGAAPCNTDCMKMRRASDCSNLQSCSPEPGGDSGSDSGTSMPAGTLPEDTGIPYSTNGGGYRRYNPNSSDYHDYTFMDAMCKDSAPSCSQASIYYSVIKPNAAPFLDRTIVSSKEIRQLPFLGAVRFLVNDKKYLIINETLPGHLLSPGFVTRQAVNMNGTVYIMTTGQGTGNVGTLNSYLSGGLWYYVDHQNISPNP